MIKNITVIQFSVSLGNLSKTVFSPALKKKTSKRYIPRFGTLCVSFCSLYRLPLQKAMSLQKTENGCSLKKKKKSQLTMPIA